MVCNKKPTLFTRAGLLRTKFPTFGLFYRIKIITVFQKSVFRFYQGVVLVFPFPEVFVGVR